MAKPVVPPALLQAISVAIPKEKVVPGKRKEASPRDGASEKQSIRPARTAIAHARGGNKGK
jgi:hypothetical protein